MTNPLPGQFADMVSAMDCEPMRLLLEALDAPATTAVRVNALKGCAVPEGADRVPWCPTGYYLAERPAFILDPALHQGLYYVQEASSMMVRHVVAEAVSRITSARGAGVPLAMLDACAAPGGKTTAAIEVLPAGSVLVANELSAQRCAVLVENVLKHGSPDVVVTRGDAARFGALGELFDIVAVDAPCSGEGMMRKEEVARSQWSPALVAECAATQRLITAGLWQALRPGGYMVYSTCTFNISENEAVVRELIDRYGAEAVDLTLPDQWHVAGAADGTALPCMRLIPGYTRGEGLFVALLHKPGHEAGCGVSPDRRGTRRPGSTAADSVKGDMIKEVGRWLLPHASGQPLTFAADSGGTSLTASTAPTAAMAAAMARVARVVSTGVEVAALKGRRPAPAHPLAMSTLLNRGAFAEVEVGRPTALDYLRRQAVTLPDGIPRGHVLLTHCGHPLGFVNNIGSRANNLYPASWRILTTRT